MLFGHMLIIEVEIMVPECASVKWWITCIVDRSNKMIFLSSDAETTYLLSFEIARSLTQSVLL